MIWTILFALTIGQGLFLISAILLKGTKNRMASTLIIVMVAIMIVTNFGYLVARTELINYVPQLFGVPFGMIFLLGPLIYFYSQSVVDSKFKWSQEYWFHFMPYLIYLLVNLPFFLAGKNLWIGFINTFLAGELPIHLFEKIILMIQDAHLLLYLLITFRWMRSAESVFGNSPYVIPIPSRIKWLKTLVYFFASFLLVVFLMGIIILSTEKYIPVTNYAYTLISSCIIYFIVFKVVLHPEILSPDFVQKYKSYMRFMGEDGEKYLQKFRYLMTEVKLFADPDLNLNSIAKKMELPTHQLSKLINEKFGKSFNDLVSEYRVNEFIARINAPEYRAYSVLGLAMDVGFNSKSSFNSTFKRITGKTPSQFKKVI